MEGSGEGDEEGDDLSVPSNLLDDAFDYQTSLLAAPAAAPPLPLRIRIPIPIPKPLPEAEVRRLAAQYIGVADSHGYLNQFRVGINWKGKTNYLGCFCDVESAARAYDAVARLIPGFALNFPAESAQPPNDEGGTAPETSDEQVRAAIEAVRNSAHSSGKYARRGSAAAAAPVAPRFVSLRSETAAAAAAVAAAARAARGADAAPASEAPDGDIDAPDNTSPTAGADGDAAGAADAARRPTSPRAQPPPHRPPRAQKRPRAARRRQPYVRAAAAADYDFDEHTNEPPPALHPRPREQPPPAPPPHAGADPDLLGRIRFKLRVARMDDATIGIDRMSDDGLRDLLGDIEFELSRR